MEDKEERSNKDSLLFQYLINILNDFYKEDEVQKEDISVINYIIEYGHLPFKYRFKDMMRVFSLEYSITDNTELDILNLKNKWVDRIMKSICIEHKFAGSDIIEDPQNIFIVLESQIKHLNEIGVDIVKDKLLKAFSIDDKVVENLEFYNDTPNSKTILVRIYKFKNELFCYILNKLNENVYKPNFFKNLEDSIVSETLLSEKGVYEKKYGFIPTLRGFGMYLISTMPQINIEDVPAQIEVLLADYVINKLDNIDNNIERAKNKQQTLIEITPHQTLSIEATSAHVEESIKVEKKKNCIFHALQIAIAVTMVNQKTGLFPTEFSKKDGEAKKKFLKDIKEKFLIEDVPTDQLFRHYANLQLSKEYLQNLSEPDKQGVKRILELGRYTELLKDIK